VVVCRSQLVFASMLLRNATIGVGEAANVCCCGRDIYEDRSCQRYRCVLHQLLIQKYVMALESPLSLVIRRDNR
jgi:hypothetical protein